MTDLNISLLGFIALIIRVLGSVLFIIVLVSQLRLRLKAGNDDLNGFRNLLIILTAIPALFNFIAIYNNYFRTIYGQQNEVLNNFTFVAAAIASTCTALVLWLLYKKR